MWYTVWHCNSLLLNDCRRPSQSEKELIDQARKVETLAARAAKREAEQAAAKALAETKAKNKAARSK